MNGCFPGLEGICGSTHHVMSTTHHVAAWSATAAPDAQHFRCVAVDEMSQVNRRGIPCPNLVAVAGRKLLQVSQSLERPKMRQPYSSRSVLSPPHMAVYVPDWLHLPAAAAAAGDAKATTDKLMGALREALHL